MWLTMEQASEAVGINSRTLSNYRKGLGLPAGCKPLKASVLPSGRVVRIKQEWLDDFMEQFVEQDDIGGIVDEIMAKLRTKKRRAKK